jgi:hypothetical protein
MQGLSSSFMALTVSSIYMIWRAYAQTRLQQAFQLRKRVTYMLWVAANLPD